MMNLSTTSKKQTLQKLHRQNQIRRKKPKQREICERTRQKAHYNSIRISAEEISTSVSEKDASS